MIATDFQLIPLDELSKHEQTVLQRLDSVPVSYAKSLRDAPEIRYAFLYYLLLTHWPELVYGAGSPEDVLANRVYWLYRFSRQYAVEHDFPAGFEPEAEALLAAARRELGDDLVRAIEETVTAELATNEREIAVAFSEFSIRKIKANFKIHLNETQDHFAAVAPMTVSNLLRETLSDCLPLGLVIDTEKARSELIVTPVLMEVRRQLGKQISLFSGVEWNVDESQGLRGRCDFLMGLTPEQRMIEAPLLAVVEVKNEDANAGIAQCLAEMVAVRIFNEQCHAPIATVYGVVTTGNLWRFLRLVGSTAYIDVSEYHIKELERIVGIIVSMFVSAGVART